MKYDLSVIIPSIRVQNLEKIHFMLEQACAPFNFEMIVVGPYDLPAPVLAKENVKYYKDLGSPSRCVQVGSTLAEGEYLCWLSDDCTFITPQSLGQCIQLFNDKLSDEDAITLSYFEGQGNGTFPDDYWRARHHGDQQIEGVKEHFKIAPLGMYNTTYFRWLGGLDCRYEHINMCTHDLAFRLQNAGGTVHLSPSVVARFYWSWPTADAQPVQRAYFEVDAPLFKEQWGKVNNTVQIDYWNWMNVPSKWGKRFG